MNTAIPSAALQARSRDWPAAGLTRVPFWVYQDEEIYRAEQGRLFGGPVWNYVCLEAEIPENGDFRTTQVGEMPVIVVRGDDGVVRAFENRCVHRGALIALEDEGNAKRFQCVYHAWTYDLKGDLKGVAFKDGANGVGGMPKEFDPKRHAPRKLRVATTLGLVFASLSEDAPPIEEYIGEDILARMTRVLKRPIEVIGRFTQALPNNWKLYSENVRDSYHASLLHSFFATFRITRLTQSGGVAVSPNGGHHTSYTIDKAETGTQYRDQGIRSEKKDFRLADPNLLDGVDEIGDRVQLQILTLFPNFVLQQVYNSLAVRQVVPRGVGRMDLHWTYFGYVDDTPEMRRRRLRQANLVGPAGYVSMEDGCVGGFVQRGIAAAGGDDSLVEMGGAGTESQPGRATETSIRGFWKMYRSCMGL